MAKTNQYQYDDSYPTCITTYSTLRIFSDDLTPNDITKRLKIEPTRAFLKGDAHSKGKLRRKTNGWFYSTKKVCSSKDTRRHIDKILAALDGKQKVIQNLHLKGCKTDITSYWMSVGQGGPWLMPEQMLRLGTLGIAVWWDVYFSDEQEK